MPRPKHDPTEKQRTQVLAYATVGTPHHSIAILMSISIKTLLKHYRKELDQGKAAGNANISRVAYSAAASGKPWAVCFWLKCQADWRETNRTEITGANGGPIKSAAITAEATDDDSMRAYLAMLKKPTKE